jgi:cytochrome c oxidase assembly factor CtaG
VGFFWRCRERRHLCCSWCAADDHAPPGWTLDPWITGPLALAALLFARGWWRLHARSGQGSAALRRRGRLYAAGLLVLAAALVSPLHQAGERSFAAHMFEHELLMLVGAPLLVLAEPLAIMLWAFPSAARRAIAATVPVIAAPWRRLTGAVTATVLQAAALWLWHAPALFDRALASEGWHVAQHLSFLVSALLFWTAMLHRRTPAGIAALCLVATAIVSGALGALMAFATRSAATSPRAASADSTATTTCPSSTSKWRRSASRVSERPMPSVPSGVN